jgi:hypothetical protein
VGSANLSNAQQKGCRRTEAITDRKFRAAASFAIDFRAVVRRGIGSAFAEMA